MGNSALYTFLAILTSFLLALPVFILEDNLIAFSFSFLGFVILRHIFLTILKNYHSLANLVLSTFIFHFFLVAPIIQLASDPYFLVNTVPVNTQNILLMNVLLSVHILTISFIILPKHKLFKTSVLFQSLQIPRHYNLKLQFLLVILILLFFRPFLSDVYNRLGSIVLHQDDVKDGIIGLLWNKVLKVVPLFIFGMALLSRKMRFRSIWICLSLIFLLIAKNPITEHRNAFGAAYLLILFVYFRGVEFKILHKYVLAFISFPLLFALGVFLNPQRVKHEYFINEVLSSYKEVHFDAWANYIIGLEYIDYEGLYYGEQLLSSLLFWVPRSIWHQKGVGTGQDLGDYLIYHHNGWFNNISSPFPLEGYVDFGIIGVVLYGILTAYFIKFSDNLMKQGPMKYLLGLYLSVNIMFLFRGPFLSSFAFTMGGVVAWFSLRTYLKLKIK